MSDKNEIMQLAKRAKEAAPALAQLETSKKNDCLLAMARNTVAGLEATSFALLCSISNLAMMASNLSGAYLLPHIGLKWLIVLSSITSFLCLPLIKKIE